MVASTGSATEKSCGQNAIVDPMIVEPVVAEPVEASKRPRKEANEDGGFDWLNHRKVLRAKRNRFSYGR